MHVDTESIMVPAGNALHALHTLLPAVLPSVEAAYGYMVLYVGMHATILLM